MALWAVLAGGAGGFLGGSVAAAPAEPPAVQARAEIRISEHAAQRMRKRGISQKQVRAILTRVQPFSYFHQGRWKDGYYDSEAKVFLAVADGVLITAIAEVDDGYIGRLKRKRP